MTIEPSDMEKAKQVYRDKPKDAQGRMTGSTSYLQRKMQWGYNHAAAVIEQLEADGWLTAPDHSGVRLVIGE